MIPLGAVAAAAAKAEAEGVVEPGAVATVMPGVLEADAARNESFRCLSFIALTRRLCALKLLS